MYALRKVSIGMPSRYQHSRLGDANKTQTRRLLNPTFYDLLCPIYHTIYHRLNTDVCHNSRKMATLVHTPPKG